MHYYAFCHQSNHNRAADVCRSLMVGHHCRKRQGQNRTVIQSVKANGVLPVDAPGIPALVDQAEASLFQ